MNQRRVKEKLQNIKGITLVALVVTIVVLLILAGITLNYVFGDNSVFREAAKAKEQTNIAKAREKLEVVLSEAKIYKHTDSKYNENEYLDEMILKKIQGSKIKGDIAISDEYAFTLDRSVPWIGEYVGKEEELVFPELNVSEAILANDNKSASFTITAREKENGISRIEILQEGHVIKVYEYNNEKREINETYIAKQNGKYVIRAYAKYFSSETVEVKGIIASINFEPNGSEEYKETHSTKIVADETTDKIVSIMYQWTNSTAEPGEETFQSICKSGDMIIEKEVTGTYYLWALLRTESGKTTIWRSEGFNFDNEGPVVELTSTPVSYSSFTLDVTAQDRESGIVKYEFYVDGVKKDAKEINEIKESNTQTLTVDNIAYGNHNCYVLVTDKLGHVTRKDITAKTLVDTTGPSITSFTATKYSETGITLSATAQDAGTGIVRFEFYIDDVLKGTETCTETTSSITKSKTITGISTGSHRCKVRVLDRENNENTQSKSASTKLYTWNKYTIGEESYWYWSDRAWKTISDTAFGNMNGRNSFYDITDLYGRKK